MMLRSFYILILFLIFTTNVLGQKKYSLQDPISGELIWKPMVGIPKLLKVKINKSRTIKEVIPNIPQSSINKTLVTIIPDTLYFKNFDKPKKGKFNLVVKPLIPSEILKSSPFVFKDNATKNIVYQDLAHGFFTNSTRCFEQDNEGYMWIGSPGAGLCKYDGFNYVIYDKNSLLPSGTINELLLDSEGKLWIGTDSGLCYIKGEKLFLIKIPQIETPNINKLTQDRNGAIWFGTEKYGLIKLENNYFTVYNKNTGIPSNIVKGIYHDTRGKYWVGLDDHKGFICFDDKKILHYKAGKGLPKRVLSDCYEDDQGVWIGLFEGGLMQFKNDSIWRHDFFNPKYDNIYSISKNDQGYWFNIYGRGIVNLNKTKLDYFTENDGLPGRHTFEVFIDDKNNIWGSDLFDGIGRINENLFSVSNHDFKRPVPNIIIDNHGDNWFCTNGGNLIKETKEGKLETFYNEADHKNPRAYYIWDLAFKDNGDTWGATYGLGCLKFSEDEFIFHYFPELGQGNILFSAEKDLNENIWFTSRDNGLIKYNGTNFYLINTSNGLAGNKTNKLFTDSKGRVWVGTDNNGVNVIKNNAVATIEKLKNSKITCFYEDRKGHIWIGTATEGAYVLKGDKLFNIQQEQGLISKSIRSFIQGDDGRYWIATDRGISLLNFNNELKYEVRNFGVDFGAFLTDFTPAVHKYDDGSIIWGTTSKMIRFDPEKERKELKEPKLILKKYKTNNKGFKKLNIDKNSINVLPEDKLTLTYSALDWGYEDKIYFEYALTKTKDSIHEWINHERKTTLNFKNIPTGNYNLYIKVVGANGVTISPKIAIEFEPFWWETLWFKAVVFFLMLITFFIFYKWRTSRLFKRQIELENAVTEKTTVIEHEKERLKKRNKIIEGQKEEIGMLLEEVNHRVKNNLTILTSLLYFQEKQIENPEAKIALQDGINRIKAISIIHEKLHEYDNHTKISFKEYIEDLVKSIESSVAPSDKNIKTEVRCDNVTIDVSKSVYLALIINELITNSYKYAFTHVKEGSIVVSLKAVLNEKYELKIYDNGPGLKHDWENNIHNSTGLNLVKMFAQQINAEMTYKNNNSSTFTFIF